MYEPAAGRITVDGVDLAELDVDEWRASSTAAFQDFCRFEFVLQETVGVGDRERMEDPVAVSSAVARAGAEGVLEGLPNSAATQLGRRWGGVELSGGQWQKLALARALMRPAPLLVVFDEPTASLDPVSEHVLFERFAAATTEARRRGAVTLLVSHRFSSVRMAERIVVLRAGEVVETGSHADLVARHGLYAELYALQARALTG
jgi:ABC-type multidrug transport system fused ATPase/permease subunit